MSDAHNEHESVIKTPKQLVAAVIAAFLIPIICIVLLVQYVAHGDKVGAGSGMQSAVSIAARLKPVADEGFTFKDANAPKELQTAEAVFKSSCVSCHGTGAAGAPKVGDTSAWAARIKQGYNTLVQNAINGIRGMPAKGGNADLDDIEVARAVVLMANQSGAQFKEPEVKAATPAQAGAAAGATPGSATTQDQGAYVASATEPPVAQTQVAKAVTPAEENKAGAGKSAEVGKKIYESSCQACHAAGVAGAPKVGDKAAWAPRLQKGSAPLYQNAIKGIGAMPPKGGSSASDDEIKAAVDYMTAAVK